MSDKLPILLPVIPECEIFQEGDSGTEKLGRCMKNPGHHNFYTVDEFEKNLPQGLRSTEVVESINHMISRTVKIFLKYTSVHRPRVYPGTDVPYLYCQYRGKRVGRSGSGFLLSDNICILRKGKACRCHLCKVSDKPQMREYITSVYTATHVIFDDSEASSAVFECFYNSKEDRSEVKLLYGVSVENDVTTDGARVTCVTHDDDLIAKLNLTHKVIEMKQSCNDIEKSNVVKTPISVGEADDGGKEHAEKEIGSQNADRLTESMGDEKGNVSTDGDIKDEKEMTDSDQTKHSGNTLADNTTESNEKKLGEVNLKGEESKMAANDDDEVPKNKNTEADLAVAVDGTEASASVDEEDLLRKFELLKSGLRNVRSLFPGGEDPYNEDTKGMLSHFLEAMSPTPVVEPVTDENREGDIYTVVMVSHPHGCSKRVSFGKILGYQVVVDDKIIPGEPNSFFEDTVCHLPLPTESDQSKPECSSPEFTLKPGQSVVLPSEMKYIIPADSEFLYKILWTAAKTQNNCAAKSSLNDIYAVAAAAGLNRYRRFDIFKTFPPGTRFFLHDKEIPIPVEAEFYSDVRLDDCTGSKASFMMYDTPTCPGSSGSLVNIKTIRVNMPLMCPTHQGAIGYCNISSIDTGHAWLTVRN